MNGDYVQISVASGIKKQQIEVTLEAEEESEPLKDSVQSPDSSEATGLTNGKKMLPLSIKDHKEAPPVLLIGINIEKLPRWAQFILLSLAVFVFYIAYGYFQELIFRNPSMRPLGWYITFLQFVIYSVYALLEETARRNMTRRIPLRTYLEIAFFTVATMGFSNASLRYLNYPSQVMFKSCKLIPVLIGGILIQGKKYGWLDFVAVCLMSLGLVMFTLADNQVLPNFEPRGYILISLALVADAAIGNIQEKAMRRHLAANEEVVLYSYSIGCLYILGGIVLSGELQEGFMVFLQDPWQSYLKVLLLSTCGYLGVNVVITLVRAWGALLAVTVTTVRKAVTIVLSFIIFSKPFTLNYVWAGLVILFAIYLDLYNKNRDKWKHLFRQLSNKQLNCFSLFSRGNSKVPVVVA